MTHFAVKNPLALGWQEAGVLSDDLLLTARAPSGEAVTIVASRRRWQEAIEEAHVMGPWPSRSEQARRMYERGEVEIEVFEREIEREMR